MRHRLRGIVIALSASVASSVMAQASQPPTDPKVDPPSVTDSRFAHHRGFMMGFSLGAGSVVSSACDGCSRPRAMGVDASAGWFVKPRIALMADVFANITADASHGASTAVALQSLAVQYWASPSFWLKGGIGAARISVATPLGSAQETGGGMTLGAGYEFWHGSGSFAMDLQGRLSQAAFDGAELTSFAVMLGVNWY